MRQSLSNIVQGDSVSTDSVELPFDFVNGQILVNARLPTGRTIRVNVDTGVSPSALDLSVAQELKLNVSRGVGAVSGQGEGNLRYRTSSIESLDLGGFHVTDLPVIVTRMRHLAVAEGDTLLGALGKSFLRQAHVEIDYPARVLRIWPRSAKPESLQHPLSNDLDLSGSSPRFQLEINGTPTTAFMDTGASGGLMLSEETARELGLTQALGEARTVQAMGVRGRFEAKLISVDSIHLAGTTLRSVSTVVMPHGPTWVGNDVWQYFRVRLSYPADEISLGSS